MDDCERRQRPGRRLLYVPVALALIGAFVYEAHGHPGAGALTRALAASALLMLVWKLWRRPGAAGILPNALWASGWLIFLGLWLALLWPSESTAAYHVVFLGGYGLLTLGIGTRVVVTHGGHPISEERRLLTIPVLSGLLLALVLRLVAVVAPGSMMPALAASAAIWMLTWALWAVRSIPKIVRPGRP